MTMTATQLLQVITLVEANGEQLTAEQTAQLATLKQRYETLRSREATAAGEAVGNALVVSADVAATVATRGLQFATGILSIFRR